MLETAPVYDASEFAQWPAVEEGHAWAYRVMQGNFPACIYVKQAIKRHLDDLDKIEDDDFPYYFDPLAAEKKIQLIQLFPHVKGEWAREQQDIRLEGWQKFGLAVVFGWLKKKNDFRRFREAYWEVPRKNGKALDVDTLIPTPGGWKRHGDLVPGDFVFSADGKPQRVIAVTPQYTGPSMAVEFSDGESITAHERHEWVTERTWFTGRPRGSRAPLPTVETRRIAETLRFDGARADFVHRVRVAGALELPEIDLPLPPYVLGAWLGDGHSRAGLLTSADVEIPAHIESLGIPCPVVSDFPGAAKLYRLGDGNRSQSARDVSVAARLRALGILGPGKKHIPAAYLRASYGQRLELLRGLVDTDGTVSKRGQVVFSTVYLDLAQGFMELVRSLGMKPSLRMDRAMLRGKDCGANYEIQFWPPVGVAVARLARKACRQVGGAGKRRSGARTITAVTPVGDRLVNCIQVETGVYLAGKGMIPTHNSVIAAGVGLAMFIADDEYGAEVYSGATSEKQAWEVFRPARLMVKNSPDLTAYMGIEVNAQNMNTPADASRFEPIIGSPGDGSSPSCAIVDEYHEHDTSAMYDTMQTGMGARRQPLMFIITTAGVNIAGPCYDKRTAVMEMLAGTVPDDELFGWIFTIDPEDNWNDPAVLAKANPNIDISVYREYLESQQAKAIRTASFTSTFKTKHLNVWTNAKNGYFNMVNWGNCEDKTLKLEDFEGQSVVLSFDLARKLDMNAMVRLFWQDILDDYGVRRHYYCVKPRFWVPSETVKNDENKRMSARYAKWSELGYLTQTDGAEVDYREIFKAAQDVNEFTPVSWSPIDPHGATALLHKLDDEGFNPVTVTQNYTNLSDPMKELEAAIMGGRFHHDGNPIMTWCMGNVIGKHVAGNDDVVRPIKQGKDNKIDGAVSLIMGVGRLLPSIPDQNNISDFLRAPIIIS